MARKFDINEIFPVFNTHNTFAEGGRKVQVFVPGLFKGKWVDVKGFADPKPAEELLKQLKGKRQ